VAASSDDSPSEPDDAVSAQSASTSAWQAPPLLGVQAPCFSFAPHTTEQAPTVPDPDAELHRQAVECQRLGSSSWHKIRFLDAQKHLQAGGVFLPLEVNPPLAALASTSSAADAQRNMDATMGLLCHGLLLQRKCLSSAVQALLVKHPNLHSDLNDAFGSDLSEFKKCSDYLLQYVCGKRANSFEARRQLFQLSNQALTPSLQAIPPSDRFLFDESRLEDFLRQHPGALRPRSSFLRASSSVTPTAPSQGRSHSTRRAHPYKSAPRTASKPSASSSSKRSQPEKFRFSRRQDTLRPAGRSSKRF